MFFDKFLDWLFRSLLVTHKYPHKVFNFYLEQVESYFFNYFIIHQTPGQVSYLLFKQKTHEIFSNYLYDFKSQNKKTFFLSTFYFLYNFKYTIKISE